jgi:hypothetical protein
MLRPQGLALQACSTEVEREEKENIFFNLYLLLPLYRKKRSCNESPVWILRIEFHCNIRFLL